MLTTIIKDGASLSVQLSIDDRRGAVDIIVRRKVPEAVLHVDRADVANAQVRARVVKRLPADLQPEATHLLEDAALDLVLRRAEGGKPREDRRADPEPWLEAVDGAALLDELAGWFARYMIMPKDAAAMLAAWVVLTYIVDSFDVVPYVAVYSPTKRCGKTRFIELLELVVYRPWRTGAVTGPVLFRKIEASHPTLLLDEAEVVRGRSEAGEIVRLILNAGYKRGSTVPRCVGDDVRDFDIFGPKLFALIGRLPDTLFDRCIPAKVARRCPGEPVERFRAHVAEQETEPLRRRLVRWGADHAEQLRRVEVSPPEFLDDRAAEVWGPLLAIGAVAGGDWLERLLAAARALRCERAEDEELGPLLLEDLRELFAAKDVDGLETAAILAALNGREDRPWAELSRGKPLSAAGLAALLRPFGVTPGTIRFGATTAKGYGAGQLSDVWARYARTVVTPSQAG